MPRTSLPDTPQTVGWIGSLEEIEELQSKYGPEVVDVEWGGPDRPWFDWQTRLLTSTVDEIGLLGGKAGGKSTIMRAWLVSGNPTEPDEDEDGRAIPVNRSYTYESSYLGLILRRNQDDLTDFLFRAQRMWASLGAEWKNGYFRFPDENGRPGARIDCGHLKDSSSWQKYIGIEYQRIAIDEAGLIPEYSLFDELRSCMRTPNPALRCQVVLASNAGGPGTTWLVDRYMKARDAEGKIIPHDTVIEERYLHPFTKKEEIRTRLWMFSTIADNTVMRDTPYAVTLISMTDPKKREAYFEGKWDALWGSYFGDLFRPDGPQPNEPANACHVITKSKTGEYPLEVKPWWPMTIGGDWGYSHDAAFLWARKDPDKRVIITEEMAVDHVLPERLGVEIGRRTKPHIDKLPTHSIRLYLGHDAFSVRTGDRTIAELIAVGISKVLGPGSVFLPDIIIRKMKEEWDKDAFNFTDQMERDKAIDQIRQHRRQGVTILIAEKTGVIGWQFCREAMRWEPTVASNVAYDEVFANRLLQQDVKAFEEYSKLFRNVKPEVLPRLQILDCCPQLIAAIPKAQHEDGTENVDKAHFKGKDLVDCFLYLMLGIDDEHVKEPYEVHRDRQLAEMTLRDPSMSVNDLVRVNMMMEADWADKNKPLAPYTPPRQARGRRLHRQALQRGEGWLNQNTQGY